MSYSVYEKYKDKLFAIRGAAMKVHAHFGCGFTEYVYQDALEIEFKHQGIPYEREKHITLSYRGQELAHDYYADFICFGDVIVELKAVTEITDIHKAQVINYLNATGLEMGIILNFGDIHLVSERLVPTKLL